MNRKTIFAKKLRRLFDDNKDEISQADVAKELDCHPDTIQKWLAKKSYPTEKYILQLAEIFDKDIEYFLVDIDLAGRDSDMEQDLIRHKKMVDTLMRENEELRQTIRELQGGKPKKA